MENTPLPLVDLRDDRTLSALDLDARISVGDDYDACRQWALTFHGGWLVERCREDIELHSLGRLGEPMLEDLVLEAADRYKLRVAFLAWQ